VPSADSAIDVQLVPDILDGEFIVFHVHEPDEYTPTQIELVVPTTEPTANIFPSLDEAMDVGNTPAGGVTSVHVHVEPTKTPVYTNELLDIAANFVPVESEQIDIHCVAATLGSVN